MLILKDPVIQERYDAILVIVDRLTKLSHLIPFNEKYTARLVKAGTVLAGTHRNGYISKGIKFITTATRRLGG